MTETGADVWYFNRSGVKLKDTNKDMYKYLTTKYDVLFPKNKPNALQHPIRDNYYSCSNYIHGLTTYAEFR